MDTVAAILSVLIKHKEHAKVVTNACLALAAMVEPDGELIIVFSCKKSVTKTRVAFPLVYWNAQSSVCSHCV